MGERDVVRDVTCYSPPYLEALAGQLATGDPMLFQLTACQLVCCFQVQFVPKQ